MHGYLWLRGSPLSPCDARLHGRIPHAGTLLRVAARTEMVACSRVNARLSLAPRQPSEPVRGAPARSHPARGSPAPRSGAHGNGGVLSSQCTLSLAPRQPSEPVRRAPARSHPARGSPAPRSGAHGNGGVLSSQCTLSLAPRLLSQAPVSPRCKEFAANATDGGNASSPGNLRR